MGRRKDKRLGGGEGWEGEGGEAGGGVKGAGGEGERSGLDRSGVEGGVGRRKKKKKHFKCTERPQEQFAPH